jgi:hypothetical protein
MMHESVSPLLQLTSLGTCLVQDSESALTAADRITSLDDIARPAVATAVLDSANYGGGASCGSRDSCGRGGTSWGLHCFIKDMTVANAELGRDLFLKRRSGVRKKEQQVKSGRCVFRFHLIVKVGGDSGWSAVYAAFGVHNPFQSRIWESLSGTFWMLFQQRAGHS